MWISSRKLWKSVIVLCVPLAMTPSPRALAAETITGAAHNQTRGTLAAGDDVVLLCLDNGMREEAHTRTDAQGSFRFNVQYLDKPYLVRVVHQGVNYDQRASAGAAIAIDVYDAAEKVTGVAGTIEIIRAETRGPLLHISDMVEIRNDSQPPVTQAGEHSFETWLPASARIDSVFAAGSGAGPGKMAVSVSAMPAAGQAGHYTVNFPLRPGVTKFAFNYDLPYAGHVTFVPKLAYPLQQLAIMTPLTMKFVARSSAIFVDLPVETKGYQVHAASQLHTGESPTFELIGAGVLPELQAHGESSLRPRTAQPHPAVSASSNSQTQKPNRPVAATPTPSQANSWVLVTVVLVVLGSCGILFVRKQRGPVEAIRRNTRTTGALVANASVYAIALQEEIVQLEVEKERGVISGEEYESAMERTARRLLARNGAA